MEIVELRELWKRRTELMREILEVEEAINKGLELDKGARKSSRKHLSKEALRAAFRACIGKE